MGDRAGDPELPHQVGARHHALHDARWTKEAWAFLAGLDAAAGERRATSARTRSNEARSAPDDVPPFPDWLIGS